MRALALTCIISALVLVSSAHAQAVQDNLPQPWRQPLRVELTAYCDSTHCVDEKQLVRKALAKRELETPSRTLELVSAHANAGVLEGRFDLMVIHGVLMTSGNADSIDLDIRKIRPALEIK